MQITRHLGHSCRILIGTSILLTLVVVNPRVGVAQNASQKKGDAKESHDVSRMPADQESIAKLIAGALECRRRGGKQAYRFQTRWPL